MKRRKPKPYRAPIRFGIINHMGEIWTPETFFTPREASLYLRRQQDINPTWKLRRHRVVPVRVTVSCR